MGKDRIRDSGAGFGRGSIGGDAGIPGGMPMKRSEQFNRHDGSGPSTWSRKRDTSPLGRKFKSIKRNTIAFAGSEDHASSSVGASSSRGQEDFQNDENIHSLDFGAENDEMTASEPGEAVTTSTTVDVSDTASSLDDPEDRSSRYKIPVGVSRLHLVELPGLKVIYPYHAYCPLADRCR
jgi:hypothetical protein